MVLEKVIDIIAEELSVDPSEITEDSNLVEDLDADSLAVVVDLVMSIEDAFNVEIRIRKLKTSRRLAKSFSSSKNIRVSNFCALREIFRLVQTI